MAGIRQRFASGQDGDFVCQKLTSHLMVESAKQPYLGEKHFEHLTLNIGVSNPSFSRTSLRHNKIYHGGGEQIVF